MFLRFRIGQVKVIQEYILQCWELARQRLAACGGFILKSVCIQPAVIDLTTPVRRHATAKSCIFILSSNFFCFLFNSLSFLFLFLTFLYKMFDFFEILLSEIVIETPENFVKGEQFCAVDLGVINLAKSKRCWPLKEAERERVCVCGKTKWWG